MELPSEPGQSSTITHGPSSTETTLTEICQHQSMLRYNHPLETTRHPSVPRTLPAVGTILRSHSPALLPLQVSEEEVKATHAEEINTPGPRGGWPPQGGQVGGHRHNHQAATAKAKFWLTGAFHLRPLPSCRPRKTPVRQIVLVPQTPRTTAKKFLA